MDKNLFSNRLKLNSITLTDDFWLEKSELVRREMIPYQLSALNDNIEGAEKSYCLENFKKASIIVENMKKGVKPPKYPADRWHYDESAPKNAFHGWVFQDSDVYKWLEAVAYSLVNHPDYDLQRKADKCVDLICSAQLENGYLDTLYIINNQDEIFTNLKDYHELYCFGHLAQAAIAYYDATGNKKLFDAACRFADLICDTFGENKIKGYPGHEIAEMALVGLYRATGDEKYLKTAEFFVDERGKKPYYYDLVLGKKTVNDNYFYNQAHIQPKYQTEAVGHAVRGVYLYSGMADVARETGDDELLAACEKIFDNIRSKKMYITGGIGATVDGEAFSFNYDLPNDLAYSETCASIGLVFFAMRMSAINPDSKYADVVERALYNTILSGMSEDAKRFFYVNPLEVLPEASHKDSRKAHIKPVRQKWFGCACCPPNLARLISSLGEYCFSESGDTFYIHQYVGANIDAQNADVCVKSSYLTDGGVKIKINPKKSMRLALRIPSWCKNYKISAPYEIKKGYAYIDVNGETKVNASFELKPRFVACTSNVRANVGKVALCRGPVVYCIEGVDNGTDLQQLIVNADSDFSEFGDCITVNGLREKAHESLYYDYEKPTYEKTKIKFIPYRKWGNRGENEMCVFVRIKED